MPRNSRWANVDHLLGFDRRGHRRRDEFLGEETALLSRHHDRVDSAIPPKEVTKVCLRLRHLVQEILPYEVDVGLITDPNSRIITPQVLKAAKEAGGEEYKGCVVYCLLVNSSWFKQEADVELWNAGQHNVRAEACGVIAKSIIEAEEDTSYLLHSVLLHRYSHLVQGAPAPSTNVIEKAVDLHAVRVIGSSGYQKCIGYLWRGWVVQDGDDPSFFVDYTDKDSTNFFVHMNPNRMRTPRNQNAAQLLFSVVYLGLYTLAINTVNAGGVFDFAEILLYFFTFGYVCDELLKVYKVGYRILGFWNVFNAILYTFLTVSLAFRVVGLSFKESTDNRKYYSEASYNILAFVAPMFWCRLLLYLDSFRFFGTMLVVLKVMLKESVIFFALLSFILVGFLQAFIGLDLAEDQRSTATSTIVTSMVKAVLANPELDGFATFSAPWGTILYYCYTFIVMTVLLNILIALYNSAYSDILSHADDEYLALFAQRTMQFVRAPDENVYIAPLNLVEIVISASSEWWLKKQWYESFNDCVMSVLYSPLLVVMAYFETRTATIIRLNRARGEEDDDVVNEWEQLENEVDFVAEGWTKTCDSVKPNLAEDPVILEIKILRAEVEELKSLLAEKAKAAEVEAAATVQDTQDAGQDFKGQDPKGQDPKGQDPKGQDPKGQDPKGQDPEGQDPKGQEPKGQEPKGQEPKGKDIQGHDSKHVSSHEDIKPNQYVVSEPPVVELAAVAEPPRASDENAPTASIAETPAFVLYPAAAEPETVVVETGTLKTGSEAAGGDTNVGGEQGPAQAAEAGEAGEAVVEESEDSKQSKSKQKKKKKETGKGKDSSQADSSSSGRSI